MFPTRLAGILAAGCCATLHFTPSEAAIFQNVVNTAGVIGCSAVYLECRAAGLPENTLSQTQSTHDGSVALASGIDVSPKTGATIQANARAESGDLGVFVDVKGAPTGYSNNYATGTAYASFTDLVTVEPKDAPNGSGVVDVTFGEVLHGQNSPATYPSGQPTSYVSFGLTLNGSPFEAIILTQDKTGLTTYTIHDVPVGGVITFEGTMATTVNVPGYPAAYYSELKSNWYNTGDVYASVDQSGYYLVSESGHDYSFPAVPLPASVWLMLSGIVGFCAFARSR